MNLRIVTAAASAAIAVSAIAGTAGATSPAAAGGDHHRSRSGATDPPLVTDGTSNTFNFSFGASNPSFEMHDVWITA